MDLYKKCAECTRRACPCVGVPGKTLDRVRGKLELDILEAETNNLDFLQS